MLPFECTQLLETNQRFWIFLNCRASNPSANVPPNDDSFIAQQLWQLVISRKPSIQFLTFFKTLFQPLWGCSTGAKWLAGAMLPTLSSVATSPALKWMMMELPGLDLPFRLVELWVQSLLLAFALFLPGLWYWVFKLRSLPSEIRWLAEVGAMLLIQPRRK